MNTTHNTRPQPCTATVGTFDGVHRGHRSILQRVATEGKNMRTMAFVLDPHPLALIAPERAPQLITTAARRLNLINATGLVQKTQILHFTPGLRNLTAAQFMAMLKEKHGVTRLVMGHDNTFGSDRLRTADDYRRAGAAAGVSVVFEPELHIKNTGCRVCSSSVRQAVALGDLQLAAALLGRNFDITADVRHGRGLGHTIGFATANLNTTADMLLPPAGVYAANATVDGKHYGAVLNIGHNPTVSNGDNISVECHLLDFCGDIYGRTLTVVPLKRLRPEKKFDSLATLQQQIAADIAFSRNLL